jgi:uncharacterized protein YjdB
MFRLRILAAGVLSLCVMVACSSEENEPTTASVITIRFTPSTPTLNAGETLRMTVDVRGVAPTPLFWASDDQNIATVDQQGLVKGITTGETLVTVRLGSNSSTMGAVRVVVR